ncbi:LLM class flavin-dependent oxidoreductase [Paenibacillus sp. SI8]|uniref:LLM class flavin-dependent oxidoreductase n=1 Tax=unclassified Paenibacillus TaxID=185978 RepID=UPI003467CF39
MSIKLYCNLPNIQYEAPGSFEIIRNISQYAEKYNFEGVLLHFNHHMLDPLILATFIIQHTEKLKPIVAVQPYYQSPLSVAKMIQSIAFLYNRKIILNVITGAAKSELEHVSDPLDHDERYLRSAEYMDVLRKLLRNEERTSYNGKYYHYRSIDLKPDIDQRLTPQIFVAGSSSASVQTALQHADTFITHPEPIHQFEQNYSEILNNHRIRKAIKVGIIARENKNEAWEIARNRFNPDTLGRLSILAKTNSESIWLQNLAKLGVHSEEYDDVFWMGGFISGKANHPLFVGSYQDVAQYVAKYVKSGISECIVGGLETESDFAHTLEVFSRAERLLE